MPWEETTVEEWTVCWKWGFIPYPCKKRRKKYCCSGVLKVRCYGIIGERWFCCGGKESHWWSACFGVGSTISQDMVCKKNVPSQIDGCPNTVGDAPPEYISQQSQSYLVMNIGLGGGIGAIIGALIGTLAITGINGTIAGALGGLILGAISGAGTGRRCGCFAALIALAVVLALLYFLFAGQR